MWLFPKATDIQIAKCYVVLMQVTRTRSRAEKKKKKYVKNQMNVFDEP